MMSHNRGLRRAMRWAATCGGILLLATAGCGGSSLNTPGFTPLDAPVLGTYTATQSVAANQGQNTFVEAPALGSGDVSNITVVLPTGALLQSSTLAAVGVPFTSNTIERIRLANPSLVSNIHAIAEVVFGQVVNTGTRAIVSATPILSTGTSVAPTYQIKLTTAGSDALDALLATAGVTSTFQVLVRDEFSFNSRLIQPENATVAYDTAQDLITVKGYGAYDLLVNLVQK